MRVEYNIMLWKEPVPSWFPAHGWSIIGDTVDRHGRCVNEILTPRIEWFNDDLYVGLARLARSRFEKAIAYRFRPLYDPADK